MMPFDPGLPAIQQWLQAVIVHPGGVAAGVESTQAQEQIPLGGNRIEDVICRSQAQDSFERLAVYSHAYKARLLEVLVGDYPALVHAVGEEAFAGLANAYLEAHPPTSYTLADLGRHFPAYLETTRPTKSEEDGPDWADFLIDLARLERYYSEVFDGPGIEGQATLRPEDLTGLSQEQWLASLLIAAPCLRLATFRFAVHGFASAVRQKQDPEIPSPRPTWLAITRRDFVVRRVAMDDDEFGLLSLLVEGKRVADALESTFANSCMPADQLAIRLREWFRNWSAAGYFVGVSG